MPASSSLNLSMGAEDSRNRTKRKTYNRVKITGLVFKCMKGTALKLLLHICCGPCSIYPLEDLAKTDAEVHGFFDNPNIHPYTEWAKRLEAVKEHAADKELKLLPEGGYDIVPWLRNVSFRESERCRFCYLTRLESTAQRAKRGRYDAFSTTLLYSRFQNHELIVELAREVATTTGVDFYYRDWREGWKRGVEESKRIGMYRQSYCGCIYSEQDRYRPNPPSPKMAQKTVSKS